MIQHCVIASNPSDINSHWEILKYHFFQRNEPLKAEAWNCYPVMEGRCAAMKERFAVEAVETAKAKEVDFVIVEESRSGEASMFIPC